MLYLSNSSGLAVCLALLFSQPAVHKARAKFKEPGYPDVKFYSSEHIDTTTGSRLVLQDHDGRMIYSSNGELM
ncbi:MAG: hypothetical protein AAGB46_12890, partial [Verrucomicrobiota bacterium]